jgi:hypothetical protein
MFPAQSRWRFHDNGGITCSIRCSLVGKPSSYERGQNRTQNSEFRVEAGWNTSTVNLRAVGGDEKGSLKSETVKYGRQFQGTQTRERLRWQGPAPCTNDRPVLSSEGVPHKKQDRNCQTVINIWSWVVDGVRHQDWLTDWLTVWLSVSRNVTLTLTEVRRSTEVKGEFRRQNWMCELS